MDNFSNTDVPPSVRGVYVLILYVNKDFKKQIGRLGTIRFRKGIYFYVGSAMGPGGLRNRIYRHYRRNKKIHWHIDYLTTSDNVDILGTIYLYDCKSGSDLEKTISHTFAGKLYYIEGFGNSDKRRDKSHLFYCRKKCIECVNSVKKMLELIARLSECKIGVARALSFSSQR